MQTSGEVVSRYRPARRAAGCGSVDGWGGLLVMLAILCGLVAGCASVPMTSASLDAEAKTFTPAPGKANIYLYRGGGPGWAIVVQTVVDGRLVGSLVTNTYQLESVDPGRHVLSTGGAVESVEMQKVYAEAGKNYFFRVSLSMGWWAPRTHLTPMSDEEGRKEVALDGFRVGAFLGGSRIVDGP